MCSRYFSPYKLSSRSICSVFCDPQVPWSISSAKRLTSVLGRPQESGTLPNPHSRTTVGERLQSQMSIGKERDKTIKVILFVYSFSMPCGFIPFPPSDATRHTRCRRANSFNKHKPKPSSSSVKRSQRKGYVMERSCGTGSKSSMHAYVFRRLQTVRGGVSKRCC